MTERLHKVANFLYYRECALYLDQLNLYHGYIYIRLYSVEERCRQDSWLGFIITSNSADTAVPSKWVRG